jgi:integrase
MGVSTSTVYKWWRRYRFHDLRHFRASCLIADGANPKEVMVEMGHASIQMTVDTYGHLFPEDAAPRRARAEDIAAGVLAPPA